MSRASLWVTWILLLSFLAAAEEPPPSGNIVPPDGIHLMIPQDDDDDLSADLKKKKDTPKAETQKDESEQERAAKFLRQSYILNQDASLEDVIKGQVPSVQLTYNWDPKVANCYRQEVPDDGDLSKAKPCRPGVIFKYFTKDKQETLCEMKQIDFAATLDEHKRDLEQLWAKYLKSETLGKLSWALPGAIIGVGTFVLIEWGIGATAVLGKILRETKDSITKDEELIKLYERVKNDLNEKKALKLAAEKHRAAVAAGQYKGTAEVGKASQVPSVSDTAMIILNTKIAEQERFTAAYEALIKQINEAKAAKIEAAKLEDEMERTNSISRANALMAQRVKESQDLAAKLKALKKEITRLNKAEIKLDEKVANIANKYQAKVNDLEKAASFALAMSKLLKFEKAGAKIHEAYKETLLALRMGSWKKYFFEEGTEGMQWAMQQLTEARATGNTAALADIERSHGVQGEVTKLLNVMDSERAAFDGLAALKAETEAAGIKYDKKLFEEILERQRHLSNNAQVSQAREAFEAVRIRKATGAVTPEEEAIAYHAYCKALVDAGLSSEVVAAQTKLHQIYEAYKAGKAQPEEVKQAYDAYVAQIAETHKPWKDYFKIRKKSQSVIRFDWVFKIFEGPTRWLSKVWKLYAEKVWNARNSERTMGRIWGYVLSIPIELGVAGTLGWTEHELAPGAHLLDWAQYYGGWGHARRKETYDVIQYAACFATAPQKIIHNGGESALFSHCLKRYRNTQDMFALDDAESSSKASDPEQASLELEKYLPYDIKIPRLYVRTDINIKTIRDEIYDFCHDNFEKGGHDNGRRY